ncbi:hypothetical protein AXG93_4094s1090 [Marchantia polymorpha subsp. ruderalis]|uniref:Uncharacterized protein n=1 Tax=Marchantia polymorpha subsp. ruderalis TaxID=1480154 RepID=A0A176VW67_MARPO|nr:hypothetical protein AXG93_4094s1090 [Marchantia polymorpha subsp. ruderalis]
MFADQSLRERGYALEKLEEMRVESAVRLKRQQANTKTSHDKKLKPIPLAIGDLVLLYDSRFFHFPGQSSSDFGSKFFVSEYFGSKFLRTLDFGRREFRLWTWRDLRGYDSWASSKFKLPPTRVKRQVYG